MHLSESPRLRDRGGSRSFCDGKMAKGAKFIQALSSSFTLIKCC